MMKCFPWTTGVKVQSLHNWNALRAMYRISLPKRYWTLGTMEIVQHMLPPLTLTFLSPNHPIKRLGCPKWVSETWWKLELKSSMVRSLAMRWPRVERARTRGMAIKVRWKPQLKMVCMMNKWWVNKVSCGYLIILTKGPGYWKAATWQAATSGKAEKSC